MSAKSYVGTMGFIFECLTEMDFFYPEDLDSGEFLKYYSSKFNCVTLRGFENLPYKWYSYLIDQVSNNPGFKFIVQLPHQFTHVNIKLGRQLWDDFWHGCKQLHEKDMLGCLVVLFNTKFICNEKNIKKLEKICKRIPSDVRVAFEFAHWTWWESQDAKELFINNPNWVMATPFLENGIVDAGWAGTIPSTRIRSRKNLVPISVSNDFAYITLNGTMGKAIGSYDEHYFLEELAVKIRNLEKEGISVFLTFNNTNSSHSSPLPPLLVSGYLCHPQLKMLHNLERDMPCCLHDASRLVEIIGMQNRSKYKIGLNGYVEVKLERH
jgi:uncharacterized protein YecE (DUF72 family)